MPADKLAVAVESIQPDKRMPVGNVAVAVVVAALRKMLAYCGINESMAMVG